MVVVNVPIVAFGLTVTTIVKLTLFVQPFVNTGVIVYVAVATALVVLVKDAVIKLWLLKATVDNNDPTGLATGEAQVYVVLAGIILPLIKFGSTLIEPPLQITCVIPLIRAIGLTVTITLKGTLLQDPVGGTGVTVKLAVNGTEFVLLITPLINDNEVPVPPETIDKPADNVEFTQLYNVFAGTILPC
jgi:hypothetical protein